MFVDIENPKSPLAIENIMLPYKKGRVINGKRLPKEKITKDVCLEILKSTNYARNIKDMLLCIAELPVEEQAKFGTVVRACFEYREQTEDIYKLGKKLLGVPTDKLYFDLEYSLRGEYFLSSAERSWCVCLDDEWAKRPNPPYDKWIFLKDNDIKVNSDYYSSDDALIEVPSVVEAPNCMSISFSGCDIKNLREVKTKKEATVSFVSARMFPECLDVSSCAEVRVNSLDVTRFQKWNYKKEALTFVSLLQDFSGQKDFSGFGGAIFHGGFISGKQNDTWIFPQGFKVVLDGLKWQGNIVDFSKCREVEVNECCVPEGYHFKFADGAKVHFNNMRDWNAEVDVANCDMVGFYYCDLAKLDKLTFKKGSTVRMLYSSNLPAQLDFSPCSEVCLSGCDLAGQADLTFAKGATVDLYFAQNLPKVLDVSMCKNVRLDQVDKLNLVVASVNTKIEGFFSDKERKKIVYWENLSPMQRWVLVKKYPKQLKAKLRENITDNSQSGLSSSGTVQKVSRFWGKIFKREGR